MARVVSGNDRATLGGALAALERDERLHPALHRGFTSLYGYTSDDDGIRHALMDVPNLDAADARFFLVACSAFTNYLKSKV